MSTIRLRSVRHKMILLVLVANFFVLIAAGASFFYYDLNQHRDTTASALTTLAGILGQGSAVALEFDDPKVANENLALLSANPNILTASIYTAKGELFAHYGQHDSDRQPTLPHIKPEGFLFEKGKLVVFHQITSQNNIVGSVYLEQQFMLATWIENYLLILGIILAVSLGFGLLISSHLQRWISGPIEAISQVARQIIAQRNYNLRATKSTEDEIGQLADAFNEMLETLEYEIAERSTAEHKVRMLNIELEQHVADRTAELQVANRDLVARTSEAEAANRAKADFLANMSHEIRTPMNAILGLAYLLDRNNLDPNSAELAKKICNAGRSLQSIINDILDFSKIEAGKLEIEIAPFFLNDVLDNLSTIMAANLGNKKIELIINPPPSLNGQLMGDPLRLEQILINLTSNAIKFTELGSVVVDIQLLSKTKTHAELRFSVKDSGIGIPLEKQSQIFVAFTQADLSTTRRFGGTGLGLTICKNLVAMMGGDIGVISEKGDGSEFWFTLPFEYSPFLAQKSSANTPLKVLILESSKISSNNLERTVQSLGWHATVAASAEAALQIIASTLNDEFTFDVILVDWKIAEKNGIAVISQIRNQFTGHLPPIILLMTALSPDELPKLDLSGIIHGTLNKPVTGSAFYNLVCEILRPKGIEIIKRSTLSPGISGKRIENVRVLVVDDSEINLEVAQRILTAEGAVVYLVEEGQTAVEWVQQRRSEIDIILMDVQMPIMDGYEATRRIRALASGKDLPIIALTAGVFKAEINAAKEAGMNAFVAKPFNVDKLLTTIGELTQNSIEAIAKNSEAAEPDSPASTLFAPLFPGIAIDQGIELWGEEEDYCRYLLKFSEEYATAGGKLDDYLSSGNLEAAKALTHKLKGAAGNLALVDIYAAAIALETSAETELYRAANDLRIALEVAFSSIYLFSKKALN